MFNPPSHQSQPAREDRDPGYTDNTNTLAAPLHFEADLYQHMIAHVDREQPNEGCGLIAFENERPVKLYPGTNTFASSSRYRMDDREVLRAVDEMDARGWWLGAIYHSHPSSPAVPSKTDLQEANWPDAMMIIISFMDGVPDVRAYRVTQDSYAEVPITVEPPRLGVVASVKDIARSGVQFLKSTFPTSPRQHPWAEGTTATGGSSRVNEGAHAHPHQSGPAREYRATIGILGGMGPLATVDLFGKIVQATPARTDQDHLPIVVYSDPRVPDRTDALLYGGEDPTPWLIHGARQLAGMGADFIVVPCNTAHAFFERVQPHVDRPLLSMIDSAADTIRERYPDARTVGLLATSGTIRSGIYQQALQSRGIDTIVPDDEVQQQYVMPAIQAVKAGEPHESSTAWLVEAARSLEARGAQVILAACTEIPVVLQQRHLSLPLVDATESLAHRAVATARYLSETAHPESLQQTGSFDLEA